MLLPSSLYLLASPGVVSASETSMPRLPEQPNAVVIVTQLRGKLKGHSRVLGVAKATLDLYQSSISLCLLSIYSAYRAFFFF